jgi:hypothetical protein
MSEPTSRAQTFHERFTAISAVARELQAVVREMATNLFPVDASVRRIGRRLDLRVNLAWKFGRMLRAEEVPEIVAAIPGGRGRRTLLEALESARIDASLLARLREAFERFDQVCESLGIESTELAVMAGGDPAGGQAAQQLERAARQVSESYEQLRGHRIDLLLNGMIALPSSEHPGRLDLAVYELRHGITRLRPGGPIRVHDPLWVRDEADHERPDDLQSLVREASTPDLGDDEILVERGENSVVVYVDPRLDRTSPITVGFMQVIRNIGSILRPAETNRVRRMGHIVSSNPTRQVVVESFQHHSIPPPVDPMGSVDFVFTPGARMESTVAHDRIPLRPKVEADLRLTLPKSMETARVHHRALVEAAVRKAGFDLAVLDELRGMRLQMDHPIPSTAITLSWSAPEEFEDDA